MADGLDFSKLKTYSIRERKSKVTTDDFAVPMAPDDNLPQFFNKLPNILAGKSTRAIIQSAAEAFRKQRGVIWAMGAHVIKCGLNPVLIDLINNRIITAIALNGAGLVHDFEVALFGQTSEDVAEGLKNEKFGMTQETGELLNKAIKEGVKEGFGLGEAVGRWLLDFDAKYKGYSLMATAVKLGVPVTIHVAIGTDIIHMHPLSDGACLGEGSMRDFRTFASLITTLDQGGVYFNIGSAVILPEVFLKAMSLVLNLGYPLQGFTTVNLDFIQHYRPMENVIKRPVTERGKGYSLIGHHEIMIPLLAAGIKEKISESE